LCLCSSAPLLLPSLRIITYFQIHSILTNKAKVKSAKINVSSFSTSIYVQVGHLVIQTNKAKTKPIQTQFNPKQTQLKPIQTQFKPNQSQYLLLLNLGASIENHRSRRVLLESNTAFVRRFQLIGFTDPFAINHYHSFWPIIEDLEQKPFLIITNDPIRRSNTIETTRGIRTIRRIEALHLDAAFSIIEEHAAVSIDDSLNPDLEFERPIKFFLSDCRTVFTLAGQNIVLYLPIRASLRAESLHTGCEQMNPFLLAGQRPDLNISEIRFATNVLNTYETFAQSISERIIGFHIDVMDDCPVERDAQPGPITYYFASIPLARRQIGDTAWCGGIVNGSRRPGSIFFLIMSQMELKSDFGPRPIKRGVNQNTAFVPSFRSVLETENKVLVFFLGAKPGGALTCEVQQGFF